MRSVQLDGLPQFLSVAELGSFAGAAHRLGISPSAVSQAVRGLERRLGIRLFNRTTRSVALTEAGARYLELVAPALHDIGAAEEEISAAAQRPRGKLRLNVLRAAHMIVLQPILRRFLEAYPEIDLEVMVEPGLIDVVARDMIGINVGPPLSAHILASPDYLARRGVPRHPRDLLDHDCVGFRHQPSGQIERWEFARGGETLDLAVTGRLV